MVGTYDLWVRRGAIVIQGATLHPSSQAHRVYAPSTHSLPSIWHSRNPYGPEKQPAEITLISCRTRIRLLGQLHSSFRRIWNHRNTSSPRILQFANVARRSFSFVSHHLSRNVIDWLIGNKATNLATGSSPPTSCYRRPLP